MGICCWIPVICWHAFDSISAYSLHSDDDDGGDYDTKCSMPRASEWVSMTVNVTLHSLKTAVIRCTNGAGLPVIASMLQLDDQKTSQLQKMWRLTTEMPQYLLTHIYVWFCSNNLTM